MILTNGTGDEIIATNVRLGGKLSIYSCVSWSSVFSFHFPSSMPPSESASFPEEYARECKSWEDDSLDKQFCRPHIGQWRIDVDTEKHGK